MHLPVLCQHFIRGAIDFSKMAAAGKVTTRNGWIALAGAAKYARAVAAGDVADDTTWQARIETCRGCPALTPPGKPGVGYCGTAFVEALDGPVAERTCGCLVAGKAAVGSERCPRGLWYNPPKQGGTNA